MTKSVLPSSIKKISFVVLLALASLPIRAQQPQKMDVTTSVTTLTAGMNVIHAEIASIPSQREQGLMYRQSMGPNNGMIFVFEQPASICMWMKNTPLPLSVAFIDDQGAIINIEDMQPLTLESHCANKQARYALEMNQGWFHQKNIKPGTVIEGLKQLTK